MPDKTAETARADMSAIEDQLPSLNRVLATWAIRVAILGLALFAVIQWQGTEMTWFPALLSIYAAVSLVLSLIMRQVQIRQFEKHKARIEAMLVGGEGDA